MHFCAKMARKCSFVLYHNSNTILSLTKMKPLIAMSKLNLQFGINRSHSDLVKVVKIWFLEGFTKLCECVTAVFRVWLENNTIFLETLFTSRLPRFSPTKMVSTKCLYNVSNSRKFDISDVTEKKEGLFCECVIGIYFCYKMWTIKSIEVKLIGVKQLCSMHLWAEFRGSTLSRFAEIGIESCQNVIAIPTDKP
jgi:hypothetical protein